MPRSLVGSLSIGRGCFACGPDNPAGLHVPYEVDADVVRARFTPDARWQGAPAYVHGGLVMTVLDEAMAWAAIALRGRFAVTRTFTTSFSRPVLLGTEHTLTAVCGPLSPDGRGLAITGEVLRPDGKVCASAQGAYYVLTAEETAAASGVPELPQEMRSYGFAQA